MWSVGHESSQALRFGVLTIIACLFVLLASSSVYAQSPAPIEKGKLLAALKKNEGHREVRADEFIELIKKQGVNFRLTPTDEEEIRQAGSYLGKREIDTLVAAVRDSFRSADSPVKPGVESQTYKEDFRAYRNQSGISDIPLSEEAERRELPPDVLRKLDLLDRLQGAGIKLDAETYFEEGRLYMEDDRFNKAVEKLKVATALDPRYGKAHYLLGIAYIVTKDYDSALTHAERALAEAGENADLRGGALNHIGIVYRNQKGRKPGEAIPFFQQALEIFRDKNPRREGMVQNNIGLAFLGLKDFVNAERSFERALFLHRMTGFKKGEFRARENMGLLYMAQGDKNLDRAAEAFREAVKFADDNNLPPRFRATVVNKLCHVYYEKKMMDESERCYDEVLRLPPLDELRGVKATAYQNTGMIRQYKKDFKGSLDFLFKALEIERTVKVNIFSKSTYTNIIREEGLSIINAEINTLQSIAFSYSKLGQQEDAIRFTKLILEIDSKHPDAYYNMACFYSLLKNRDEAIRYLRNGRQYFRRRQIEGLKIDSDFDYIRDDPEFKKIMYGEQ